MKIRISKTESEITAISVFRFILFSFDWLRFFIPEDDSGFQEASKSDRKRE
jgi:hypothetical protein